MTYDNDIAEARRRAKAYMATFKQEQEEEDEDDRRMYVILYAAGAIIVASLIAVAYFILAPL